MELACVNFQEAKGRASVAALWRFKKCMTSYYISIPALIYSGNEVVSIIRNDTYSLQGHVKIHVTLRHSEIIYSCSQEFA